MQLVDHNTGQTDDVESPEQAKEIIASRSKWYEARSLREHYRVTDDNGKVVLHVVNDKEVPLSDDPVTPPR